MIEPEAALRMGVGGLLAARGERELAQIVHRSEVELVGPEERWEMGARAVTAHRVGLVVSATDHVRLSGDAARLDALREAFATAMRTPDTELSDLVLVLRLEPHVGGWHRIYRGAPSHPAPERPSDDAILGGAIALCEATGAKAAVEILERARLESSDVPASVSPLRRFLVRLDPRDFARTEREPLLADRIRRSVRAAGVTAESGLCDVELGVALAAP
jgi:hypothetical protein